MKFKIKFNLLIYTNSIWFGWFNKYIVMPYKNIEQNETKWLEYNLPCPLTLIVISSL